MLAYMSALRRSSGFAGEVFLSIGGFYSFEGKTSVKVARGAFSSQASSGGSLNNFFGLEDPNDARRSRG